MGGTALELSLNTRSTSVEHMFEHPFNTCLNTRSTAVVTLAERQTNESMNYLQTPSRYAPGVAGKELGKGKEESRDTKKGKVTRLVPRGTDDGSSLHGDEQYPFTDVAHGGAE